MTQIYSGISNLVAQNPPAPPVNANAVTTSFGPAITSAVNATSGTTAGPPVILTSTLVGGTAGTSYTTTLIAVGGTGTLTWDLDPTSGPLPNGMTLATNGQLSGTPQQNGTFPLKVRVTDAANPAQSATKDLVLTIVPAAAPSITTSSPLPNGVVNQPYSQTFAATGGTGTLTWTSTGALPNGLALSPGGVLSGTPQVGSEGTYNISVTVTDSTTPVGQSDTESFALTIAAAPHPPLTITTTSLPDGAVNTPYNQSLAATGGTQPYTWSVVSGSLAPLALSAAGAISGTPVAPATLLFTVQVTDANSLTARQALSIAINPAGGSGGAGIAVTNATPASGNTNISGAGVTVATTFDTLNGVPVTRVQVDGTSGGIQRRVLVYFTTATGAVQAVSYFWGNLLENIVYCPAAGCTGASVNMGSKVMTFANTALDNNNPFTSPDKFSTLNGTIQYP